MKYFFFAFFMLIFLLPDIGRSQADGDTLYFEKGVLSNSILLNPEAAAQPAKLPLEWRGLMLSLDASNRWSDRFSRMSYGLGGAAVIGYKNYNFRFESILPISGQGWLYRIKLEYQVF